MEPSHLVPTNVLTRTDFRHGWVVLGPLVATNTLKGISAELPTSGKFFGVFFMFWDMSLKPGMYIRWVAWHIRFEFRRNQVLWPTLQRDICQIRFSSHCLMNPPNLVSTLSPLAPTDFCSSLAISVLGAPEGGPLVRSPWFPVSGRFFKLLPKCFQVSTWKLVNTLSRLHSILISHFTKTGSLWRTSCS